jgi:alkylation response protein AidB-like acyl-CoA dehydrogenase
MRAEPCVVATAGDRLRFVNSIFCRVFQVQRSVMNVVAGITKIAQADEYGRRQQALAADYLARARSIVPLVQEEADATERSCMITKAVHEAFVGENLYWMMLPRALGGPELGARGGFQVIEEISFADGSTGWSLMANAFNNSLASSFMPDEGAELMYGGSEKAITCGQFSPAGKAVEAEGGLLGGGHYQFGSGSGYATWIGGGVVVYENGAPRMLESGIPDTRVIHVPQGKYKLCGNWDVIGLIGTASFDYEIPEQFVPNAFVMEGAYASVPLRGGPFHHFGWFGTGAVGHSAIALGMMRRALQEMVAIVQNKKRLGYSLLVHEHPVFKYQFAVHEASYQAGRHLILNAIDRAEDAVLSEEGIQALHYARLRQACSWIHKAAADVVGFCHHWGASQAFRNPSALGRCTRDLSVATQHLIADETAFSDNAGPIYDDWLDQKNPPPEKSLHSAL